MSSPHTSLPPQAETYIDAVIERVESLIETDIWSGLQRARLNRWLENFQGTAERFLAANILDKLVYRSHAQTDALITQLYQRTLSDVVYDEAEATSSHMLIDSLRGRKNPGVRLVPVLEVNDSLSSSAPTVARFIKQRLGLNEKWICSMSQLQKRIENDIQTVIFVDDFLGTGYQFKRFYKREKINTLPQDIKLIYAPLVAHRKGIAKLNSDIPRLKVVWAEKFDDEHNLFREEATATLKNGEYLTGVYKAFLHRTKLNILPKKILGYSSLGLCLAFQHGTPNATLPILWHSGKNFNSLFNR